MKSILGLISVLLLAVTATAGATPVLVGTTTNPTGIDGIVVSGVTYDVTFSTTTFSSPFTQGTSASGAAAVALASALNGTGVISFGGFSASSFNLFQVLVDPPPGSFGDMATCGYNVGFSCGSGGTWQGVQNIGTGSLGYTVFPFPTSRVSGVIAANFAVASVPEPATLALLGLGLFGLAAMRRRSH